MATKYDTFKGLHENDKLFILANAWDAQSAKVFMESDYSAVGTSSAAVAASLGYADGEGMPFSDYLFVITRIVESVSIPVTVDMEMGYGKTPEAVYSNLEKLIDVGVVGVNIEDSEISNGTRTLRNENDFAKMITFIKNKLTSDKKSLFINVRCDSFLLNVKEKQNEATRRVKLYEQSGADGIFLPFISNEEDIRSAVATTKLPLNVMALPGIPSIDKLAELGVKRLSMGPFLHGATYREARKMAVDVLKSNSLKSIL